MKQERVAWTQKEIKRIKVMELLAGRKRFCPQNRRAPTLSLRRVDVDFLFAHWEMRKMDCGGSISYKGRTYAPNTPEKAFMARSDVEVRESLSGKIWVIHKGCRIEMREVEKAERAAPSYATLDCQSKSNRQIEKSLIRGTKAETLSWTVVQPFYNP